MDRLVFRLADCAQFGACFGVKLQILDRRGRCLLYKCACLVKRQWQAIQLDAQLAC